MTDKLYTRKDGGTAMIFAALGGHVEAMKFVLDNGGSMKGVMQYCNTDETKEFCRSSQRY